MRFLQGPSSATSLPSSPSEQMLWHFSFTSCSLSSVLLRFCRQTMVPRSRGTQAYAF